MYKYKLSIGNAYGDCYVGFEDGNFYLGVDCQIQERGSILISERVAKELINGSCRESTIDFVFGSFFSFEDKWDEISVDDILMYNETWSEEHQGFIVTTSYKAKDKFDFVMKLIGG